MNLLRPRFLASGRIRFAVVVACVGAAAIACRPLTLFNAFVPKDDGSLLVERDAKYGPEARQTLDVYRPRDPGKFPLPVIIFFYGGSWNSGTKQGYAFVGRALASRGFIVAIPDYRLVPQVRYPVFLEDCAAAVRWVHVHASELGGDPDRLVLAGHSAGAYNGAMLAYDPRWLGPEQRTIKGFVGLAGPYDFLPFDGPITREAFLGTANAASTQPVNFASRGDPPAFLATGTQDRFVRPANSDALAARLRRVETPVVRRSYPGIGHVGILTAIARPLRGRAAVLDDISAFAHGVSR